MLLVDFIFQGDLTRWCNLLNPFIPYCTQNFPKTITEEWNSTLQTESESETDKHTGKIKQEET